MFYMCSSVTTVKDRDMARDLSDYYCPNCKAFKPCRVGTNQETKDWAGEKTQRLQSRSSHPDLNWVRRVRKCLSCDEFFTTAEIAESMVSEVTRLRRTVAELQKTIEENKNAAQRATEA